MTGRYLQLLGRSLLAAVASGVLLTSLPAGAQPGQMLPPNVGTGDCDRACLEGIAELYVDALIAHDPNMLPLAKGVRYSENGVELPIPDGFFKNATGDRPYRLYVADPEWGTIGFFARMYENGTPVLKSTRLKIFANKITEIEVIVAQERWPGWPRGEPMPEHLGEVTRPEFRTAVPVEKRRSRDDLMKIVNTYFTGIENNEGKKPPIFSSKCHRLEVGQPTSNVELKPGEEPGAHHFTCAEGMALGYYRNDNRLRNRRILAVDVERQVVLAGVYFDHVNSEYIRSFQLNDGRTVNVTDTMPTTIGIHEAFSIDEEGISQVEAVFTSVTYGQRPYFSTGFHMDSEGAVEEGFVEWP